MAASTEVLQGTLDLLILKTVALEPMHGWGIAQRIQQVSREMLQIQQGSLYPALYRLERKGLIRAEWGASDNNRRAKFYSLTKKGTRATRKRAGGLGAVIVGGGADPAASVTERRL